MASRRVITTPFVRRVKALRRSRAEDDKASSRCHAVPLGSLPARDRSAALTGVDERVGDEAADGEPLRSSPRCRRRSMTTSPRADSRAAASDAQWRPPWHALRLAPPAARAQPGSRTLFGRAGRYYAAFRKVTTASTRR